MLSAITGGIGLIIGCLIGWIVFGRKQKPDELPPSPLQESLPEPASVEIRETEPEAETEDQDEQASLEDEMKQELETLHDLAQYRGVRIEELETEVRRYRRRASEHLDRLTAELTKRWQSAELKNAVFELPEEADAELIEELLEFAKPMKGWMRECGLGSASMSYQLGLIEALAHNWEEAAQCFEKAAFDGLVPDGWLALGDCHWQLERPKKAVLSYKKCLEKSRMPNHIYIRSAEIAYTERRFSDVIQILKRILSRTTLPVEAFSLAALAHSEMDENDKAIAVLEKGLQSHQDAVPLIAGTIIPLSRLGDEDGAKKAAERAYELDSEDALAPYALGVMHMDNSEDDQAIECFEDALVLKPEYPEALCGLGIIFNRRGEYKKALEHFEPAIALKADYAEVYYHMSTSYQELRNFDESIAAMNTAVKLNPDYA